jgi:DNA-binding MarR family transcriptional regulator
VAEPDETLSEAYWEVARILRHASRESLSAWGIAPSHARALGVLASSGPLRLSDLSDHLHIAARSTTEVVDALEERGLVERQADPGDRRATLVVLTDAGRQVTADVQASRSAGADRLFGSLSPTDQAHLARILRKVRRSAAAPRSSGQ